MASPSIRKKIAETSPAAASTVASTATIGGLDGGDIVQVIATLTGATGGTLDVYLVDSFDGGTTWLELCHFPQLADGGAVRTYTTTQVLDSTITTVGKNTTAATCVGTLAANTVRPGPWGDQVKAVFVAGGGTSVGAAQVVTLIVHNARR